jgi:hypothetical protein
MEKVVRTVLMLTLGLGLNVLCAGRWADEEAAAAPASGERSRTLQPAIESIWSTS